MAKLIKSQSAHVTMYKAYCILCKIACSGVWHINKSDAENDFIAHMLEDGNASKLHEKRIKIKQSGKIKVR
jgi:hypothetical protein